MKLIILAAGSGSRLKNYTVNNHKSLLKLPNNQTILSRIISQFKKFGVNDISIITGHKSNLIKKKFKHLAKIKYYKNFKLTNNLHTLLAYKKLLKKQDTIISFSDLVVNEKIIEKFINNKFSTFSVAVDLTKIRNGTMKVKIDNKGNLIKIGKIKREKSQGNFIGLSKIPQKKSNLFIMELEKLSEKSKKNYYTETFNSLIKLKKKINTVNVKDQWIEVDNFRDYNNAKKFIIKNEK